MTTERAAIFKPLGLELTRQMEAVMGRTREDVGSVDLPPRLPETKEVIESKLIPCERCGTVVAMLIFAPNATDAGRLEDYAGKMFSISFVTEQCPRSRSTIAITFPVIA